ncbi:MAG TPA: DUF2795 domain-containing protein [Candidatus Paceibacterota bacterium]|nr:DUF2795 domain-containing protein [Candidatus Paceibacterota bacterium]
MAHKDTVTISNTMYYVKGMPFPALRQQVIEYAREKGASGGIIDYLERNLSDREFGSDLQVNEDLTSKIKHENTE